MNEERSLQKSLKDKNSVFWLHGDALQSSRNTDVLKLLRPGGWPQFFLEAIHMF